MHQQHIFDLLSSFSPSPPYLYAGLGTQYYVTTVSCDIFGRAMPGTYFRAESAYFKREKDDSRDILTAFKDRRRFLDISNYEKQKKKICVICTLTEKAVKDSVGVSEKQVLEFRLQCKTFLIELLQKLLTKCPASYSLARNLSALNSREMASNVDHCISRFKKVVTQLVSVRRIKESDCDAIIQEYTSFLDNIPAFGSEKFSNFNFSTDRLDELFSTYMNTHPYQKLFKVAQLLLVLSHGQASVERGFSVDKELEVENLANQSLVAQCLVCDHINAVGGILNVSITQPLLTSCSAARKRYERYLEQQRQNN